MVRRMHFGWVLWAGVVAVMAPSALAAQLFEGGATGAAPSVSATGLNVSTTVEKIIFLSVADVTVTLTAPTDEDFDQNDLENTPAVVEDLDLHELVVSANADWEISLSGPANWTTVPGVAPAKPIGHLEWSVDGGTNWEAVTNTPAEITSGNAVVDSEVDISYRTTWYFEDTPPGTYATDLTLALAAP